MAIESQTILLHRLRKFSHIKEYSTGGLFFSFSCLLSAIIMIMILNVSYASQAVAEADHFLFITANNTAVYSYLTHAEPYERVGDVTFNMPDGFTYDALQDFNTMLKNGHLTDTGVGGIKAEWDGKNLYLQSQAFTAQFNIKIYPHMQSAVIEGNSQNNL